MKFLHIKLFSYCGFRRLKRGGSKGASEAGDSNWAYAINLKKIECKMNV